MEREIAAFLRLPNPENYSGHSFRRSSATLLVDAGADITTLKRHGGWNSSAVAEGYIDDSIKNPSDIAKKISSTILTNTESEQISIQSVSTNKQSINFDVDSTPTINVTNCTNVVININK